MKHLVMKTIRQGFVSLPGDFVQGLAKEFPGAYDPDCAQISFMLRSTASRINDTTTYVLTKYKLTARSINLLIAVYEHGKDGMAISVLGQYVHTAAATLTSAVKALEREKLVTRQTDPADRRSIIVRLTPKGRRLTDVAFPVHARQLKSAMRSLSLSERKTLMQLLGRINDGYNVWEQELFGKAQSRLSPANDLPEANRRDASLLRNGSS